MKLHFKRYFSNQRSSRNATDNGRRISQNVALINILVHDVTNLLYYEHRIDKQKYFYVYICSYRKATRARFIHEND